MTREEAIKVLTLLLEVRRKYGDMQTMRNEIEAIEMAIKALEQKSILDKIRAEIIELRSRQNVGVLECLDIIDKYKESEDKE